METTVYIGDSKATINFIVNSDKIKITNYKPGDITPDCCGQLLEIRLPDGMIKNILKIALKKKII